MQRALFLLVLASLGFLSFALAADAMPLFEWHISEFTEDFPPTMAVNHLSSPWTPQLGDVFDDGRQIYSKVFVSKDKSECLVQDLRFLVRRSQYEEMLEKISFNFNKAVLWLDGWGFIVVLGIHMWCFILSLTNRSISKAIISTLLIGAFGCCFINVFIYAMKVSGGMPHYYMGRVDCDQGTIAFTASLSKIHYETVAALFTGLLIELGVAGVIVCQILSAIIHRKQSERSAVG